jgi:hypothetical protein
MTIFIYLYTRRSERDAFVSDFSQVADRLVESFVSDTAQKFWLGYSISNMATLTMELTNSSVTQLTIPQDRWRGATFQSFVIGRIEEVSWAPILYNDEERIEFEVYANSVIATEAQRQYPPCLLCGDASLGYVNRAFVTEVPGFGAMTCGQIDDGARKGGVPEAACGFLPSVIKGCICGDIPEETAPVISKRYPMTNATFFFQGEVIAAEPYNKFPYSPIWQTSLESEEGALPTFYNQLSDPVLARAIEAMLNTSMPVISESVIQESYFYEKFSSSTVGLSASSLFMPIFDVSGKTIVGAVVQRIVWHKFLTGVVPVNSEYVRVVIETSYGQNFTYSIEPESGRLILIGDEDYHDATYDHMVKSSTFADYEEIVKQVTTTDGQEALNYCRYRFLVFATNDMETKYITVQPMVYASVAASIFLFTSMVFAIYDATVHRRQNKVMDSAMHTNDIVSNLFPENVRERLLIAARETGVRFSKSQMQNFLSDGSHDASSAEPIADLFPDAVRDDYLIELGFSFFISIRLSCSWILRTLLHGVPNDHPLKFSNCWNHFIRPSMTLLPNLAFSR